MISRKLIYILVFAVLVVIGGIWIALKSGFYTVLEVNGESVRASRYYGLTEGFNKFQSNAPDEDFSEENIEKSMILSLILDELVSAELNRRGVGEETVADRVRSVVNERGEEDIEKAVLELYGWDLDKFIKLSLKPQARTDLLREEFEKEGADFNAWINESFINANVKVKFLPWKWQEGELVKK